MAVKCHRRHSVTAATAVKANQGKDNQGISVDEKSETNKHDRTREEEVKPENNNQGLVVNAMPLQCANLEIAKRNDNLFRFTIVSPCLSSVLHPPIPGPSPVVRPNLDDNDFKRNRHRFVVIIGEQHDPDADSGSG